MKKLLHNSEIYKFGFTLAEVLITLVIIGVIAAMTIPTMINNLQRNELRSQFKKAVSVTTQAVQKMKANYGDVLYTQGTQELETYYDFVNKFKSNFSVACEENCVDLDKYKSLNKTSAVSEIYNYFKNCFTAQDGMIFCFNRGGATHDMYVFVDVNGLKKPNTFGYDTFGFDINLDNQILVPSVFWKCNSSSEPMNGLGCTKKAISDTNYFKNLP